MVHGGGHHSHHSHHSSSDGGWGGSRSYQHNYTNHRHYNVNNSNTSWGQDDCDNCETVCCTACCIGCCCVACSTANATLTTRQQWCRYTAWAGFLFLILTACSAGVNDTWTLNQNETRQVPERILEKSVSISTLSGTSSDLDVFAIHKHCPSRTGPRVVSESLNTIQLARDDFQYDYFFFNKGTVIDINVTQKEGFFNIYIFRGLSVIKSDNGYTDFDETSIVHGFSSVQYPYHLRYQIRHNDNYVVLYDNGSTVPGSAQVGIHVNMTSFNLKGLEPMACSDDGVCNAKTDHSNEGCIIVKANEENVTVKVHGERDWLLIVLISCIPFVLGSLSHLCKKNSQEAPEGTTTASTVHDQEQQPLVENPVDLPPPTAPGWNDYESIPAVAVPGSQATAPLEEQDEPVPIVQAYPVPIEPPTKK